MTEMMERRVTLSNCAMPSASPSTLARIPGTRRSIFSMSPMDARMLLALKSSPPTSRFADHASNLFCARYGRFSARLLTVLIWRPKSLSARPVLNIVPKSAPETAAPSGSLITSLIIAPIPPRTVSLRRDELLRLLRWKAGLRTCSMPGTFIPAILAALASSRPL